MKNLDSYLEEAIENIRQDREVTKELLDEAIKYLSHDESRHREVGQIVAKYVETLQRSNEQLVKISALLQKKQSSAREELTESDKEELFDMINGGRHDG